MHAAFQELRQNGHAGVFSCGAVSSRPFRGRLAYRVVVNRLAPFMRFADYLAKPHVSHGNADRPGLGVTPRAASWRTA